MKSSLKYFIPLTSVVGALVIIGCVNPHSSVKAKTAPAISPITTTTAAGGITNAVAVSAVVAEKDKPETNMILCGVSAAPKTEDVKTSNGCHSTYDFSWLSSLKDYWYAIISAIIGALIGIWWTKNEFEKARRKAGLNCLERLKTCIQFNLERLDQAKGQFAAGSVPNYPFDTAQLNHWLIQSHEFISPELLRAIDWQRYQLDHISTKLIVANVHILITNGAPLTHIQVQLKQALINSLATHVDTVLNELPPLLNQLPKKE